MNQEIFSVETLLKTTHWDFYRLIFINSYNLRKLRNLVMFRGFLRTFSWRFWCSQSGYLPRIIMWLNKIDE